MMLAPQQSETSKLKTGGEFLWKKCPSWDNCIRNFLTTSQGTLKKTAPELNSSIFSSFF
jgi:hypothetical protein